MSIDPIVFDIRSIAGVNKLEFGKASVAVCKEAFSSVKEKISDADTPDILKN